MRAVLGNDHPDTLMCLGNYASVLVDQEKFDEADTFYKEALDGHRATLGDRHKDTAGPSVRTEAG